MRNITDCDFDNGGLITVSLNILLIPNAKYAPAPKLNSAIKANLIIKIDLIIESEEPSKNKFIGRERKVNVLNKINSEKRQITKYKTNL